MKKESENQVFHESKRVEWEDFIFYIYLNFLPIHHFLFLYFW